MLLPAFRFIEYTRIDLSGSTDPDTGDIYSGLDRFGRIKDCRWLDTTGPTDLARYKYGYDRASNRLWREDTVAASQSQDFDELYAYDGLYRLANMQRGRLNAQKDGMTTTTFEQCWTLDETGNWNNFRSDDDGSGSWDINQTRTANEVNEILSISPPGKSPDYDAAGNLTRIPSDSVATGLNWETFTTTEWDNFTAPPTANDDWSNFGADKFQIGTTFTYDAWNRLVTVSEAGDLIQTNHYDGRNFRIVRETTANARTGAETRHFYFSAGWQSLEERLDTSTDPERQYVWGQRYIDGCVLRDRDTTANGTLDERFYPTQDANWNVTALVDTSGTVQERYAYSAYGVPTFLDASYGTRAASSYAWETLFCGYRYDTALEMFHVRNRTYNPELGVWLQRDPIGYADGMSLSEYTRSRPTVYVDPVGLQSGSRGQAKSTQQKVYYCYDYDFEELLSNLGDITDTAAHSLACYDCAACIATWKDPRLIAVVCSVPCGICGWAAGEEAAGKTWTPRRRCFTVTAEKTITCKATMATLTTRQVSVGKSPPSLSLLSLPPGIDYATRGGPLPRFIAKYECDNDTTFYVAGDDLTTFKTYVDANLTITLKVPASYKYIPCEDVKEPCENWGPICP